MLEDRRGMRLSGERWLALDGLRGVAILLVLAAHSQIISAGVGGMVGVTLFFVLSGFLITNLLIEELVDSGRIDLMSFYGRRALRLLPPLGLYLLGISVLISLLRLDVPVVETSLPPIFYMSNYAHIFGMDLGAHQHTWSLAVEEHFYLLWPVMVALGATRRVRLLGAVVLVLVGWRFAVHSLSENPLWAYEGTDTNAYALGIGALLASVRLKSGLPTASRNVTAISVGGLVLLSLIQVDGLSGLYRVAGWVTVLAAALSATAVWGSIDNAESSFLSNKTLRWFGLISYSLYLWHAPLLRIPGLADTAISRLVGVSIAIGVAWVSWIVIEHPIMKSKLRRRLSTARRTSVSAPSSEPSMNLGSR